MVEFKVCDLPDVIRERPLKLGSCPHGVPMVTGREVFIEHPQFHWNYHTETGNESTQSSSELDVSAKISIFLGLLKAEGNYSKHKYSGRSKNAKITECNIRVQRGMKYLKQVKRIERAHCSKDSCKDHPMYVDTVCIGGEATLSLCMDSAKDSSATSQAASGGISVFGMKGGTDFEQSESENSGQWSLHACYTSSLGEPIEFHSYSEEEFAPIWKELENKLLLFPKDVASDEGCIKYVFQPVQGSRHGVMDSLQKNLDSKVKLENVLRELSQVKEQCLSRDGCRLSEFARRVDVIIQRLEDLKKCERVAIAEITDVYGDHAMNFYLRELKRLTM